MIDKPRIGIFVGTRVAESDILILQGITAYTRSGGVWRFTYSEAGAAMPIVSEADLNDWQGDGLLTLIPGHPLVRQKLAEGIPVVSMSYQPTDLPYQVLVTRRMCGVLGAQHLLNQGYRSFALLFDTKTPSCEVDSGYLNTLQTQGFTPTIERIPKEITSPKEIRAWCANWLRSLKEPVGIMTAQEILGCELLAICEELELNVPNDVGILGVAAGQISCDSRPIGLSRVKIDLKTVGYEAARMMDQLLNGETPAQNPHWIVPDTVVLRESTNRQHPEDNIVNKALHYIQMNADKNICVEDVVQYVRVSRSTLKTRFRKQLDRTITESIRASHIERAKLLLRTTDLGIGRIAPACGFTEPSRLSEAFKRETGITPLEFRQQKTKP